MCRSKIKNLGLLITGGICIAAPITVMAAPNECGDWVAKVVSTEGRVETRLTPETAWQSVAINQTLCPGSVVHTQAHSRAALLLRNNTVLRLSQKSTLTLPAAQPDKPFWLELLDGAINVITRTPKRFQVDTPFVNAAVDGTEFFVKVARPPLPEGEGINSGQTTVSVFEGRVIAENSSGRVTLRSGEAATADAGQAPVTSIPINPREAVQWALHYPPILGYRLDDFKEGDASSWQAQVRKSIEYTQAGDMQNALASVIDTPQDLRNSQLFAYRASLLLNVGRVSEASADIKTALDIAPNDGIALALQSVIAVAQNQHETALTLAKQSIAQAPQVAGSWMALSYAQQANFNLPEALNAAQHGADNEPDNALAWARIAELHLMTGNLDAALAAASKATALNPNLARTQSVLGFVYLSQIKTKQARQAFEQAIILDQADPLPRLGLGLAKIRDGDLAAGREDIEIATALDPNNALVRSYMGKAYYEEKRDSLAATQFDIAKTLDPKDPTPWFYDAILKQSTNHPVEALQDLQKSIELNDNRAVYRSRLLLDQDQAARSVGLARTYADLGFNDLAQREASRSISNDPANYAAHRFLADSYISRQRSEIARASELLQSQLLQPLTLYPIQPRTAETNLNLINEGGPLAAAFNEFGRLFVRDNLQFSAHASAGNRNTWSDEIVLAGINGSHAYSLGQFHYSTDGFRDNADVQHDIFNAFWQTAATSKLNVQMEYRQRDTEQGDIALNIIDPGRPWLDSGQTLNQDTVRLGIHYTPIPRHDLLLSLIYNHADTTSSIIDPFVTIAANSAQEGRDLQVQHIFRGGHFSLVSGAGAIDVALDESVQQSFDFGFGLVPILDDRIHANNHHRNAYTYIDITASQNWVWTLGLAYDGIDNGPLRLDKLSPKMGIQGEIAPRIRLRTAAYSTTKRMLVTNQTLEPTQIAGFNQFLDDNNGATADIFGVGLDALPSTTLNAGIEFNKRRLQNRSPDFVAGTVFEEPQQKEYSYNAYVGWTPFAGWSFGSRPEVSRMQGSQATVDTHTLPLWARYFNSSGLLANIGFTFAQQTVSIPLMPPESQSEAKFALVDITVGYRLPKRCGLIGLEINNLFDRQFKFQDLSAFSADPFNANPRFLPARTIMARATLTW